MIQRRDFISLLGGAATGGQGSVRAASSVCHICPVPDQARASDRRETRLIAE
jgi:hypothetical protein